MEKEKEPMVMLEVDISLDSLCIYMLVSMFKFVSANYKLVFVICLLHFDEE